jgi:hypothetical protein
MLHAVADRPQRDAPSDSLAHWGSSVAVVVPCVGLGRYLTIWKDLLVLAPLQVAWAW